MARFHESHPGLAHAELDFYGERERDEGKRSAVGGASTSVREGDLSTITVESSESEMGDTFLE
jgi:hypothetical protein